MKEQPDHTDSTLSETMVARIEIQQLGDSSHQKEITDAIEALDGVIELKIEKGALHVSYDPLATSEKKIEEAIRSTGKHRQSRGHRYRNRAPRPASAADSRAYSRRKRTPKRTLLIVASSDYKIISSERPGNEEYPLTRLSS